MAKEKSSGKARASVNPVRHSKFGGVFLTTQVCFFLYIVFYYCNIFTIT